MGLEEAAMNQAPVGLENGADRAARIQSHLPHQTSIIRTRFSKLEMGSDFFYLLITKV